MGGQDVRYEAINIIHYEIFMRLCFLSIHSNLCFGHSTFAVQSFPLDPRIPVSLSDNPLEPDQIHGYSLINNVSCPTVIAMLLY